MKKTAIAVSLITLLVSAGCSEKNDGAAPPASPAATSPAPVINSVLAKDVPSELKGSPFENAGQCSIDMVNSAMLGAAPEFTVNRADGFKVDGWALDQTNAAVAPVVVLQLAQGNEHYYAMLGRHAGRDDLIKAYGKSEFANAGYAAAVDIASLPAGQYEVSVIQKGADKNMVCSTNRKMNLNG
jgi:hypothetical protein